MVPLNASPGLMPSSQQPQRLPKSLKGRTTKMYKLTQTEVTVKPDQLFLRVRLPVIYQALTTGRTLCQGLATYYFMLFPHQLLHTRIIITTPTLQTRKLILGKGAPCPSAQGLCDLSQNLSFPLLYPFLEIKGPHFKHCWVRASPTQLSTYQDSGSDVPGSHFQACGP